jgi:hypothetical protein
MTTNTLRNAACVIFSIPLLTSIIVAQDSEKPVKRRDLPKVVQKTVDEQSKGARILGFSKEVEDGKTFYEVSLKTAGHNKDVLIDPTGAIVEIEEEVAVESLPPAVRTEIQKRAGAGRITSIESITKNNAIVAYEAHVRSGKKSQEIKVDPEGRLITK